MLAEMQRERGLTSTFKYIYSKKEKSLSAVAMPMPPVQAPGVLEVIGERTFSHREL